MVDLETAPVVKIPDGTPFNERVRAERISPTHIKGMPNDSETCLVLSDTRNSGEYIASDTTVATFDP